jgi:hypothetical protein
MNVLDYRNVMFCSVLRLRVVMIRLWMVCVLVALFLLAWVLVLL